MHITYVHILIFGPFNDLHVQLENDTAMQNTTLYAASCCLLLQVKPIKLLSDYTSAIFSGCAVYTILCNYFFLFFEILHFVFYSGQYDYLYDGRAEDIHIVAGLQMEFMAVNNKTWPLYSDVYKLYPVSYTKIKAPHCQQTTKSCKMRHLSYTIYMPMLLINGSVLQPWSRQSKCFSVNKLNCQDYSGRHAQHQTHSAL